VVLADFQEVIFLPVSFGGESEGTPESLSGQKYGLILVWFGISPKILSGLSSPAKSLKIYARYLKNLSDHPINAAAILLFDLCCSLTFGYVSPGRTVSDADAMQVEDCLEAPPLVGSICLPA
jgi:hypothetical protein